MPNFPSQAPIHCAIDTAHLCEYYLKTLGHVFRAIHQLANEKDSNARNMAEVGRFLAEDWSNVMACEQRDLNQRAKDEAAKPPAG